MAGTFMPNRKALPMSPGEWVAIAVAAITAAGGVLCVVLPVQMKDRRARGAEKIAREERDAEVMTSLVQIAKDAREAKEQVKNDHPNNLRDEQDERYKATMSALTELGRDVRGLREDNYATRKDIGMLQSEDRAGRRETAKLRSNFAEHIEQTSSLMPTLEKLVRQNSEN